MVNPINNLTDSRWYDPNSTASQRPAMEDWHFTNRAISIADMFEFSGVPQSPKPTQASVKSFNLHEGSATNTPSSPKPIDQNLDQLIQATLNQLRQDIVSFHLKAIESSSSSELPENYFKISNSWYLQVCDERLKKENEADAKERENQLEILMLAQSLLKDMGVVKPEKADLPSKAALETDKKEQSAAAVSTTTTAAAAATPSASASAANSNPPGGPAMAVEDDEEESTVTTTATSIVPFQHQKITRIGHSILYEMTQAEKEKLKNSAVLKEEVCPASASAAKNLSKVAQGISATASAQHRNYDDESRQLRQSHEKSYDEIRAKILKAMQEESERHRAFSNMLE